MQVYGIDALVRLVSHFAFVYLTFWAMQSLRTESFFKQTNTTRIRMLFLLISFAIGFIASSFFLECMTLVRNFMLTIVQP